MSPAGRLTAPSAPTRAARDLARRWRFVVTAVLYATLSWPPLSSTAEALDPMLNQPAADFTLKSHAGDNLRLSEYRGHVVAVVFWKTRCRECLRELERWEALYQHYREQGLRVLVIASDVAADEAASTALALQVSFPLLLDTHNRLAPLYLATLMPTSVVVDKDGKQRYIHRGYRDTDDILYDTEVRELLKEWQ